MATGNYDEDTHVGDRGFRINNGIHLSFDSILTGEKQSPMLNNPFSRFHQSIEDYPQEHGNLDDEKLFTHDNFERLKPLMPKAGSTVGTTTLIPTVDTDEKLIFYDTQGESLYTNPPNPNCPVVDHGLDEDHIWAFRKSNYNQKVIYNPYTRDIWSALKERKAPWWGIKLATPAFFKEEKYAKFFVQFTIRMDFERLKLRHATELITGDLVQRDRQIKEVESFMATADSKMLEYEMRDVYITDHKVKAPKFSTLSAQEDFEYYNYVRSLEDYNKTPMRSERVSQFESGRYERGSLKQRIFEPLAAAKTLENGTIFYEVKDVEITPHLNEDNLRKDYEKMKNLEPIEASDENEVRIAMFDEIEEMGFNLEEWDKILAHEFNTFKTGEKYDYVTDLRRTFDEGVATSTASRIFKKMPAHVFWDIKKPLTGGEDWFVNPYNPARKYPYQSFFDMRRHEDWLEAKEQMRNLNTSIS